MPHLTQNSTPTAPRLRGTRLTGEEKQRFTEVLDRTEKVKDAALAVGISLPAAYRLAKERGWKSPLTEASSARGKRKTKYTPAQKDAFFAAFDRHQNLSKAARDLSIPIGTCFHWVRKAGLKTPKLGADKREYFLRLRSHGMSRREALVQVGVNERTARDWDNGVRRSGHRRFYPDGRVVDYKSGMTMYTDASGRKQATANPSVLALDKQIDNRFISLTEREEIYALRIAGSSMRQVALKLGRSPSTISRELSRNSTGHGDYQVYAAHRQSVTRRGRPKEAKLASPGPRRDYVACKLQLGWSPEQICWRMMADYPDDLEMRVCHETIYQAIYLQPRGGLKREVAQTLRSGRGRRKPQKKVDERRPRFRDPMINISERPAEVEDRAVPGHWEGDLIMGSGNQTAIGTLVERATRFVMLVHLPGDHTAQTVRDGLIETMLKLPEALRGSLTWDQGIEMALHKSFAMATDMDVYFCDPHSPWQRGSNENTNGLLRQYFPKGTDLSKYGPEDLEQVAALLNGRPRKTLDWKTPAERMRELLSVA